MKKGDVIERRKDMPIGTVLMKSCPSEEFAEEQMLHIEKHYNFREIPRMKVALSDLGGICIVLDEDSYLSIHAKINWIVDQEVAIEYLDTGGMTIINLQEETDWVVINESTPVYQDSVEHMTDEELKGSIEELRAKRLVMPAKTKSTMTKKSIVAQPQSAEDKRLAGVLDALTPDAKMELMRKLGMIE